jgi:hypothetical protein
MAWADNRIYTFSLMLTLVITTKMKHKNQLGECALYHNWRRDIVRNIQWRNSYKQRNILYLSP